MVEPLFVRLCEESILDRKTCLNAKCIEAAVKGLPPLPPIVTRILEETEREEVSASQVEKVLSSDQALVAKVLRIVNSSYYGLAGQVRSISQAIVILGMQQVRNLVIGIHAMGLITVRRPSDFAELRRIWKTSFGTAVGSRAIGKVKGFGESQLELLFVGGLLNDIGELFLLAYFPAKLRKVWEITRDKGVSKLHAERLVFGLTHREIGGMLASQWKLPADLTTLMQVDVPPADPGLRSSFLCIQAASEVSVCLSPEATAKIESLPHQWVGLTEEEWEWLKREVDLRVRGMSDICGLAA